MQQPTSNDFAPIATDDSKEQKSDLQTLYDLNTEVPDIYHQLPKLLDPLPRQHKEFVHSLPPELPNYRKFSVFLAGSIEMGKAVLWQPRMALELSRYPITVLNPRRPEWNDSKNSIEQQVNIPFVETFADLRDATMKMLKEKGMELETNGDLVGDNIYVPKPTPKSNVQLERDNLALQKRVDELGAKLKTL
ncbi:hypothetical protein SLS60_011915 [Paraconiothyrium brasiliense]|uniref:Uncharacterized protein n=1 Tax=Paraconiothyrium brasiliense TaxID=300254 RepID=A0ABR3QHK9_9PLEO